MRKGIAFKASKDNDIVLRTETLFGKEYLVVPIIALVQGVLQGLTAPEPELALTEEFGKVPDGWNGRPVVMNHPIIEGTPVSANSPSVLESYAFGYLFNTKVEDDKLKTEAWIDLERVNSLGGEFSTTVERIQNNQDVEVSTGLFCTTENKSGKFNGKKFKGIWRNIVPDHLAILSEGVLGACSVADGCGAPRLNAANPTWQEFSMATEIKTATTSDCGCGCGGKCKETTEINTLQALCAHMGSIVVGNITVDSDDAAYVENAVNFFANSVPDGLMDSDVRSLLQTALKESNKTGRSFWIRGFTKSYVVYETYDYNDTYVYLMRTYSIADDKTVTLGDEVTRVNLITQIVPIEAPSTKTSLLNNAETTTMADIKTNETQTAAEVVANGNEVTTQETTEAVTDNAKKDDKMKTEGATPATPTDEPAKKPKTMQQYLNDLPEEMREVFSSGLKLHNSKKADLIKNLKASGRCKFSDEQLGGFNLEMLENLSELAHVPTYEGSATPRVNATVDDDAIPAPPSLWDVK